jgi:hypothetical protein
MSARRDEVAKRAFSDPVAVAVAGFQGCLGVQRGIRGQIPGRSRGGRRAGFRVEPVVGPGGKLRYDRFGIALDVLLEQHRETGREGRTLRRERHGRAQS